MTRMLVIMNYVLNIINIIKIYVVEFIIVMFYER